MKKRLYVGNLPYASCVESELRMLFSPHNLVEIKIVLDRETHQPRGFCFIEFETEDEARTVIEQFNGMLIGNRTLSVSEAREPQRDGRRDGGRERRDNRGRQEPIRGHGWDNGD